MVGSHLNVRYDRRATDAGGLNPVNREAGSPE
jgi:hypothetical protein